MKTRLSPLLFCLVFACGDEPAETGDGPPRCRDYTEQAACVAEQEALLDLYLHALGMIAPDQ